MMLSIFYYILWTVNKYTEKRWIQHSFLQKKETEIIRIYVSAWKREEHWSTVLQVPVT